MTAQRRMAGGILGILLLGAAACSDDGDKDEPAEKDGEETAAERAPAGVVQVVMPADIEADVQPLSGAVGTETLRISVEGTGEVDEVGRGRAARRPAEGEKFVVTRVVTNAVPVSEVVDRVSAGEMAERSKATFGVEVGGAEAVAVNLDAPAYTPLPIDLDNPPKAPIDDPNVPRERLLVLSVPEDTDRIDLVVASKDVTQRISLLDAEPAADNISVLARTNRELPAAIPGQDVSARITEFGFTDQMTEKVGVAGASLQWAAGLGDTRRAGPGRAFLHVAFDLAGLNFPRATELRLPDGTVVQPLQPEGDNDILSGTDPVVVFDVPAGFTEGTVVLGKDYSWDVPTGGTMSARFDALVEYPIAIPAG